MKKDYKILIADDSLEVQEAVKNALQADYKLNIVSTPEEAINYSDQFDLLLTDFYFGEGKKNGLDIIESWKNKNKDLAAILMSSGLNKNMVIECLRLGAGVFKKYCDDKTPIDNLDLKNLIKLNIR